MFIQSRLFLPQLKEANCLDRSSKIITIVNTFQWATETTGYHQRFPYGRLQSLAGRLERGCKTAELMPALQAFLLLLVILRRRRKQREIVRRKHRFWVREILRRYLTNDDRMYLYFLLASL